MNIKHVSLLIRLLIIAFCSLLIVLIISMAIIISTIYDDKAIKLSSVEIYKDLIDNCVPSSDMPADPSIFINNGTHTFQLQTCRWNGTNGVNMSDILWDNLRNTFNNE